MSRGGRRERLLSALMAAVFTLAPAELLVRASGLDYKLIAPLLYYQEVDLRAHVPVSGPRLYGLRPGFRGTIRGRRITVDSLGFRGPERAALKPAGTFRVLCYGSSNTYGALVDDGQTWPARLERELSRRLRRRVEVWNGGVSAYNLTQTLVAAREGERRFQPDLVLIQPLWLGRRPFLFGQDFRPCFEADPSLWIENLPLLPFFGTWADGLLLRSRAARALVVAANRLFFGAPKNNRLYNSGDLAVEDFLAYAASTRVPFVVVAPPETWTFFNSKWFQRRHPTPVISLDPLLPPGAGPEYRLIHPPAHVYRWYARAIADQLERRRLLPVTEHGQAAL